MFSGGTITTFLSQNANFYRHTSGFSCKIPIITPPKVCFCRPPPSLPRHDSTGDPKPLISFWGGRDHKIDIRGCKTMFFPSPGQEKSIFSCPEMRKIKKSFFPKVIGFLKVKIVNSTIRVRKNALFSGRPMEKQYFPRPDLAKNSKISRQKWAFCRGLSISSIRLVSRWSPISGEYYGYPPRIFGGGWRRG